MAIILPQTQIYTGGRVRLVRPPEQPSAEQGPVPPHLLPAVKSGPQRIPDEFVVPIVKVARVPRVVEPKVPVESERKKITHAKRRTAPPPTTKPQVEEVSFASLISQATVHRNHLQVTLAELESRIATVRQELSQADRTLNRLHRHQGQVRKSRPVIEKKQKRQLSAAHLQNIKDAQQKRTKEERRESARLGHQRRNFKTNVKEAVRAEIDAENIRAIREVTDGQA